MHELLVFHKILQLVRQLNYSTTGHHYLFISKRLFIISWLCHFPSITWYFYFKTIVCLISESPCGSGNTIGLMNFVFYLYICLSSVCTVYHLFPNTLIVVAFLQEPCFANGCMLTGWPIFRSGRDIAILSLYNFAFRRRNSIVFCTLDSH